MRIMSLVDGNGVWCGVIVAVPMASGQHHRQQPPVRNVTIGVGAALFITILALAPPRVTIP
jgi:hypothetical protein